MVDTLVQAGVERVYGLPGDSLNGFTDSIRKQKKLQWIHVRHEETAAFAAGAEAHLTGPSGSADIAGTTVHPAQGVMTLTVISWPRA